MKSRLPISIYILLNVSQKRGCTSIRACAINQTNTVYKETPNLKLLMHRITWLKIGKNILCTTLPVYTSMLLKVHVNPYVHWKRCSPKEEKSTLMFCRYREPPHLPSSWESSNLRHVKTWSFHLIQCNIHSLQQQRCLKLRNYPDLYFVYISKLYHPKYV